MTASMTDSAHLYDRYRQLQRYVGWKDEDVRRVLAAAEILRPTFGAVIEDFYSEIDHHDDTRKVITGGQEQIQRLKETLHGWMVHLFAGDYGPDFVASRFRVARKHVDIGLEQVYTNVAMSRIRTNLLHRLAESWQGDTKELGLTAESLNKLMDLDLAIIEDAYQAEHTARRERYERLAAIGQVAGGIAHELRNPLNTIKTSVYYLRNARRLSPEKTEEHLARIDRQVGIADSVITALSDFSKLPIPNLCPVRLEDCVRVALDATPLPEAIEVVNDLPVTLSRVLADQAQIAIVLGNLIRNARDAMPSGGRLTFSAKRLDEHVELSVSDTGAGIPAEQIRHIMEPLFSTKARGIGLGLAITRSILEKHSGDLRVVSKAGEGTTFTLLLTSAPD